MRRKLTARAVVLTVQKSIKMSEIHISLPAPKACCHILTGIYSVTHVCRAYSPFLAGERGLSVCKVTVFALYAQKICKKICKIVKKSLIRGG